MTTDPEKSVVKPAPDTDSQELANLGYKQEFEREWNFLSTFSYAFSMSGLIGSISITMSYSLINGGAAAVISWLVGSVFCLTIAYSVSEIVSEFPSSGSLTYALSRYVSEKYKAPLSWLIWWLYIVGCVTSTASGDFGCAEIIAAVVSASTDFKFVMKPYQVTLVAMAIMILHGFINSIPSRYQGYITKYYCMINIGVTIALMIHLLVKCEKFNSAHFIFAEFENGTGWHNNGFAFFFSFLQISWVLTSYDGAARISEEAKDAAYKIPLAISSALTATAILGWAIIIVLVAVMGDDVQKILATGQNPFVMILYNVLGKETTVVYMSLIVVVIFCCGTVGCCSLTRTYWAFARDKGLPYSDFWHHLDSRSGVPVRCAWLITVTNMLLSLINIGSETAIQAIFSACAIATDWSYVVCIAAHLKNREKFGLPRGPFNFGRFSKAINAIAIVWTAFISVIFILPNYMPVTAENMNYTIVMLAAAFIGAGGWYVFSAHKWYTGPVSNLEELEAVLNTHGGSASISSVQTSSGDDERSKK